MPVSTVDQDPAMTGGAGEMTAISAAGGRHRRPAVLRTTGVMAAATPGGRGLNTTVRHLTSLQILLSQFSLL